MSTILERAFRSHTFSLLKGIVTSTLIGQSVSHYKILEHIGGGGMGVVYRARDLKLDRLVALKFLSPDLTREPQAKHRFIQEARAASVLQHNNICVVYDTEETEDGQMFISMEYLEGETLRKKIDRGPLPIGESIDIAVQIAQGLARAHAKGIVHRDIKPANIFLTTDGGVKIVDFGLAKLTGISDLTKSGMAVGTTSYMSPEQGRGEDVDGRTDVWSFSIVLFEMLTGHSPFRGEHEGAAIYSILHEPATPVETLRPDVPEHVSHLIQWCLNKDREARPQAMSEVLEVLRGKHEHTGTPPRAGQGRRSFLLRYAPAVSLILIVALILWLNRSRTPGVVPPEGGKWRIAVMPFVDLTKDKSTESWPLLIQAMMVDQLIGEEKIGVVDAASLNGLVKSSFPDLGAVSSTDLYRQVRQADISYIVGGKFSRSDSGYVVSCTMIDPASQEVQLSGIKTVVGMDNLSLCVQELSQNILTFLHVRARSDEKNPDLKPWLNNRTKNLAALEAFMMGFDYSYNMRPGGNVFFRKAIQLDSTFISPRIWLLASLINKGEIREASDQYHVLLALKNSANPFEQALIRWSGGCLENNLQTQVNALKEALEYSPRNNILLYSLGRTYYLREEYKEAAEVIQPAVDMKWRIQPAHYMLGICYNELKRFKEARQVLENSLRLEFVYPPTYGVLAALALLDNDSAKSMQYAQIYFEKENGLARDSIFSILGSDYSSVSLHDKAIECIRNAIALKPDNPNYHEQLGEEFVERGSPDSAVAEFDHTLKLDPSNVDAHRRLGGIFESKGDRTQALRHYMSYLREDTTSAKAREIQRRISILMRDINNK